mmetsp:Transcript_42971/g.48791  ORF Transcript_42971/g.48791 Transcript_42971/m.48791 type:complete len:126 (+) Transcript_42971:43-420(+)
MFLRLLTTAVDGIIPRQCKLAFQHFFHQQPILQVCGLPLVDNNAAIDDTNTSIWFAVPKSKISHSRKREKQFHKNHIPHKKNIIFCKQTGEVTLSHRLPYNWRDYIPTFEYEPTTEKKQVDGKKK